MSRAPEKKTPPTTGHSWDGIEEYDNPMPRWWLWTFYACIVWALIYTVLYPAWPLVSGATSGIFGWSTRAEVQQEIESVDTANAEISAQLVSTPIDQIEPGTPLYNYARNAGAAIFRANCSQCHGSGAAGAEGFPNLLDDDWLWGGTSEEILYTITHGIRNTTDGDARYSEMPKFGADGLLEKEQVADVVQYVLQLSGQEHDAAQAEAGMTVFADNCVACHGEEGKGDPAVGAPNLSDRIWLYGGTRAAITNTVNYAHFGVMPAWGQRLKEADVKAAAIYVHQLGGGQ